MRDETGCEFPDFDAMRNQTRRALPDLVRDAIRRSGEHDAFTVLVRNQRNDTVYTATLTLNGLRVPPRPGSRPGGWPIVPEPPGR